METIVNPSTSKISCMACGQHMDVSEIPAFTRINCVRCGAPLEVPKIIKNFQLFENLGSGDIGQVFKGWDPLLQRWIAAKLLRPELSADAAFITHFGEASRAAATLNHVNIVQVYSFGEDSENYFLVMEYVDGGNLKKKLSGKKILRESETLDVALQVANALRSASNRGILHQNLKPQNILFTKEGRVKLVDFGLTPTVTGANVKNYSSTPQYQAPEKLLGLGENYKSDIYSLGLVMFEALTGTPPFSAHVIQSRIAAGQPLPALSLQPLYSKVSGPTLKLIEKMLSANADRRHASYDELITELSECKIMISANLTPVNHVSDQKPVAKRPKISMNMVVAAITVLTFLLAGWFLFKAKRAPNPVSAVPKAHKDAVSTKPLWEKANSLMVQGKYESAGAAYSEILPYASGSEKTLAQIHHGLTLLLLGKRDEANQNFFGRLPSVPLPDSPGSLLSYSLNDVAILTAAERVPLEMVEKNISGFDRSTQAVLAWILSVKHISTGNFERGKNLLEQFLTIQPGSDYAWINDLHPVAQNLINDYQSYQTHLANIQKQFELKNYAAALSESDAALSKVGNPLIKNKLLQTQANIRNSVNPQVLEAQQKELIQKQKAEDPKEKAWAEFNANLEAALQQYDFAKAQALAQDFQGRATDKENKERAAKKIHALKMLNLLVEKVSRTMNFNFIPEGFIRTKKDYVPHGRIQKFSMMTISFGSPKDEGRELIETREFSPEQIGRILVSMVINYPDKSAKTMGDLYLGLAVYFHEYGFAAQSQDWRTAAKQKAPEIEPTIKLIFTDGK